MLHNNADAHILSLGFQCYNLGNLRHDYLIKYDILMKCYLERFASINDPENWTTNLA